MVDTDALDRLIRSAFVNGIALNPETSLVINAWFGEKFLDALELIESRRMVVVKYHDQVTYLVTNGIDPPKTRTELADLIESRQFYLVMPALCTCERGDSRFSDESCLFSCHHQLAYYIYDRNARQLSQLVTVLDVDPEEWLNTTDTIFSKQIIA